MIGASRRLSITAIAAASLLLSTTSCSNEATSHGGQGLGSNDLDSPAVEDHTDGRNSGAGPRPLDTSNDTLASDVRSILDSHSIGAAAVGVLSGGRLTDEIYFGEARPGVAVDHSTQFEIASITKTVVAETVLRLSDEDVFQLDEPLSEYWVDPDVADDPRHQQLTARLVLTHRTGFPNWRFFREDGRLVFEHDPGSRYGYSGEGFNYLGRAIENKLGKPLPEVVQEVVFDPLSMESASIQNDPATTENFAMLRTEDGELFDKHCRPGFCFEKDGWNAAGLMTVTLRDYARFLAAVGNAEGSSAEIVADRDAVHTLTPDDPLVDCEESAPTPCPDEQGYGLGFEVARTGDSLVIGHGGFDYSTVSNAYIDRTTGDGLVIFLTGPNRQGLEAMAELQTVLNPASPYAAQYRSWAERARSQSR